MQRILRLLAPFALLLAATALVACGGGSSDTGGTSASSKESAQSILEKTFSSGDKKVEKGKVNLTLKANTSGGSSSVSGPIDVSLSGPFQSEGKGKVPKFDMAFNFSGGGRNVKGSVTSTGDKGFVGFNGQNYAVDDATFSQFKKGYTDAQKQQGGSAVDFNKLGIKPATWFNDPKNEGDSSVGGTDTVKITASSINIANLARDLNTVISKAGSLGLSGTGTTPSQITQDQIKQAENAVKTSSVELETGKDDSILRRLAVKLSLEQGGQKADVDFTLELTDLGEDQDVKAPSGTKPLSQLLSQFGGLGALGGLGGSSSGSSSGSGSSSSSGVDQAAAQKYTQCLQKAGSDSAKLQQCGKLLNP